MFLCACPTQTADFPYANFEANKIGSFTFLVALKLAQFDFLKAETGVAPILLLDDAFDKLDQQRVSQIISLVDQNDFGQIFITDTHEDRTLQALSNTQSSYELFKL